MYRLWLAVLTSLFSLSVHAYFDTVETGDSLEHNQYKAYFGPQLIFNDVVGANFIGRLDAGLGDGLSARGTIGVGKVDFELGASAKYVPFPDTDQQPAVGAILGFTYGKISSMSQYTFRVQPIVSKKLPVEFGSVTPYGSLVVGATTTSGGVKDEAYVPVQLIVGAEISPEKTPAWTFFTELGANVNRSYGYISVAVAWAFDDAQLKH